MPPSTAAVNAFSPGMKPLYGLMSPYWTPKRTPAAPPIAPPIRNVSEMIRLTSMPMRLAAAWSSATARMAVPTFVRLTIRWRAHSIRSAPPMTTRDLTDTSIVSVSSKRRLRTSMVG